MNPLELIVFDCDGVLVDSERICNTVLAELLVELGAPITLAQTIETFIGKSPPQTLELAAGLLPQAPPEDFLARLATRTRAALDGTLRPVHGVAPMLAALATPCCVASNGNRAKMGYTLAHTGLSVHFAGRTFSADDVARPKPAPDLFLHAARQLGAAPERCLVVEDTPTGIAAARAAGMRVYGYAGLTPIHRLEAAGPDGIIHDMHEVLALPGVQRRSV